MRVGADVGNGSTESRSVVQPLRIPSVIHPERHNSVVVRKTDKLLCGGYKWVCRFEMPCISTRWTGERRVEQMSRVPWHGGLETVWLLCDEAQQVRWACPLIHDAGSQS